MDAISLLMPHASHKSSHGRRTFGRTQVKIPLTMTYKSNGRWISTEGHTISVDQGGLSVTLDKNAVGQHHSIQVKLIPHDNEKLSFAGRIAWFNPETRIYGIKFKKTGEEWLTFLKKLAQQNDSPNLISNRRLAQRRRTDINVLNDRRRKERRYSDLIKDIASNGSGKNKKEILVLPAKFDQYSADGFQELRSFLEKKTETSLKHISHYSEAEEDFRGKIENPIGVVHVPLGIAGPLKINGKHASGHFFIPLATTEGALVTSYNLGSLIVTRSGGANVSVLKNELRIGPIFVFKSLSESLAFTDWLNVNFGKVKEIAEKTSKHIKLIKCETIVDGRKVNVNFHYNTKDAMGMNMACKATEASCRMIAAVVKPEEYWLRSNFNANKKATFNSLINGYGRTVTADVTIPRKLISLFDTTPEQMQRYVYRTLLSDSHAGMIGANGHFANAIAAIYIACGQDVALTANSHLGISTCEVTASGDLYFSVYLSSILLGTVGGGTSFGTGKECLKILGCFGSNKADKLAEIVAATALAGEISICASIVNGSYVHAHETFGRNKPEPS
jgi:hydroxymethylglutaryl-CoA reductase (NADPH)